MNSENERRRKDVRGRKLASLSLNHKVIRPKRVKYRNRHHLSM